MRVCVESKRGKGSMESYKNVPLYLQGPWQLRCINSGVKLQDSCYLLPQLSPHCNISISPLAQFSYVLYLFT